MKRTLKRELKVLEIVKGEANVVVGYASAWVVSCSVALTFWQGNR